MTALKRSHPGLAAGLISLALMSFATIQATGQIANFHQFNGIHELPNHTVSLDLGGTVPSKFRSYFDLYLLEVSRDMTEWNPLASLLRTNASTDPLTYTDTDAGGLSQRFYRVSSNLLVTPFMQPTGPFAVGTF